MQNINATKKVGKTIVHYEEIPERVLWFYHRGYLNSSQSAKVVVANISILSLVALVLGYFQPNSGFNYSKPLLYLSFLLILPIGMRYFRVELYRFYPLILFTLIYDILSILQFYFVIHPSYRPLYYFDKYLFGWIFGGVPPSFYFFENHNPWFDIFFSIIYFSQVVIPPILFFYYRLTDPEEIPVLVWGMGFLGVAAASIFLLFPTAAPWYIYNFGFDPTKVNSLTPDIATAGLWNADQALGTDFFVSFFWSNTQAKFAAFPSLHVGVVALFYFFVKKKNLAFQTSLKYYLILMFFTVVYLNHHWVADALAGFTLAYLAVQLSSHLYKEKI